MHRQKALQDSLHLAFVGPDEAGMNAKLQFSATQLGVESHVHFPGPLSGEAKWSAFRDADIFVLPSQNENFGNTAAEAVAAGTPVILTDQCGIAPLLADIAGLVVKHDRAELASAIETLLLRDSLYRRLKEGCPIASANLAWEEPLLGNGSSLPHPCGPLSVVGQSGVQCLHQKTPTRPTASFAPFGG